MKNTTKAESRKTYAELTADVNKTLSAYVNDSESVNDSDSVNVLKEYATMVAYSTINKRNDPQRKTAQDSNKTMTTKTGSVLLVPSNSATEKQFDGLKRDVANFVNNSNFVPGSTIGNGADLVQDAIVAMLEQAQAHNENGNVDIENTFTERKLDKHVKIRTSDSNKWKDVETTSAQKIFSAVGKSIDDMKSVKSASEKYGYIELDDNADDSADNRLYLRYGCYSGIGGTIEHDGIKYSNDGITTADATTAHDMLNLIASLNLTVRQASALKYSFAGYGYKAIASKLNVSAGTVQQCIKDIRKKAIAVGIEQKK